MSRATSPSPSSTRPCRPDPRLPAIKETIAVLELRLPQPRRSRVSRVRSIALAVIGIGCGLVLLGGLEGARPWAAGLARAGEARAVTIDNYSFSPSSLTVPAGTTVTWTNRDGEVHTVVADDSAP